MYEIIAAIAFIPQLREETSGRMPCQLPAGRCAAPAPTPRVARRGLHLFRPLAAVLGALLLCVLAVTQ